MPDPGNGPFGEFQAESVFKLLFNAAGEGLLVVDRQGRIVQHNPRLNEMFGYTEGELDMRPMEILLPDALHSTHAQHRANYDKQPVQRSMGIGMDLRGKRKDGTIFPVEVSLNHFTIGQGRFVMGLVTDITMRHTAEMGLIRSRQELEDRVEQRTEQLRAAEANVRKALDTERELHALKSRFVAMASHEFRTPLSTIMGSVDLINRYTEGTDEKVAKHVTRIRSKVREMTAMLNEFLSLEKMEQGHVQPAPTDFDIVHLCIALIEELRAMAKPGQTINYGHGEGPSNVCLDKQMLSNLLANLVTNAIKYSPEGKPVHLSTAVVDGRLRITVADQGMGIPAEDQQHLFDRFFRGSNASTIQGTGLGLNLVKRYLELMGGTISFNSEPGSTQFTVDLPQNMKP
ncbi:MAG: PAS domain S-box protein [Flavobacteriales bacterium]|nr:PAS domain S-box protein [Flavobacteriales bacterium]